MDFYILYYAMILANNPDCNLLFNDFIDACDEDSDLIVQFQDYLNSIFIKEKQFKREEDTSKKK